MASNTAIDDRPMSERAPEMTTLTVFLLSWVLTSALCHLLSMMGADEQMAVGLQNVIKGMVIATCGATIYAALTGEKMLRGVYSGLLMLALCLISTPNILAALVARLIS